MTFIKKSGQIAPSKTNILSLKSKDNNSVETKLRRKLEQLSRENAALRIIQDDYREMVEHAIEMIFKLDPTGNFTFTSAEFGRALGYENGELLGEHFISIIHPDDIPSCVEAFKTLVQVGKAAENLNFQVKHLNGTYIWVNCSTRCLFDERGIPTYCIGFAHNITELVKSQELLAIENKRYIETTKAMAQAVVDAQEKERADIGYELHDNINQILSTAGLYLDLARNDDNERLALISKSSQSIKNAISEIRQISRSLVPGSITDLGLVASILDLVESIQSTKALHVEFHHEGDIDTIITDKRKLMIFRIIQEQVTNVLKHAEASLLVIELIVDEQVINLSISDNGKGFDKETIKAKKGMGLHNIANRTELFNGTANMVTSPGKGCKLKIHIPMNN